MPLDTGGMSEVNGAVMAAGDPTRIESYGPSIHSGGDVGQALRAIRESKRLSVDDVLRDLRVEEREERVVVRDHVALPGLVAEARDLGEEPPVRLLELAARPVLAADERVVEEHAPRLRRRDPGVVHGAVLRDREAVERDVLLHHRARRALRPVRIGPAPLEEVLGSVEYGVEVLDCPLVVVLGHDSCGAVGAACDALASLDLRDEVAKVKVPVLVLVGEQDEATPPAMSHELAAVLPDARLKIIPGCAHVPQLQAPEIFLEMIADFLPAPSTAR